MAQNPSALAIQKATPLFCFQPRVLGWPWKYSHGVSLSGSGRNLKNANLQVLEAFSPNLFFVSKFQTGKTKTNDRFTSEKHPWNFEDEFFLSLRSKHVVYWKRIPCPQFLSDWKEVVALLLVSWWTFCFWFGGFFFVVSWVTCRLDGRLPLHTSKTHRPLENSSFVELT